MLLSSVDAELSNSDFALELSTIDFSTDRLGREIAFVDRDLNCAQQLRSFERLAKDIAAREEPLTFSVGNGSKEGVKFSNKKLGNALLGSIVSPNCDFQEIFERYRCSPLVEAFIEILKQRGLWNLDPYTFKGNDLSVLSKLCQSLTESVSELRTWAENGKAAQHERNFRRGAQKNFQTMRKLFHNLMQRHAKLLLVRVDLNYREGLGVENVGYHLVLKRVRKEREQLLKKVRKEYGAGMVGYVWKQEYGLRRGYHYHMLFFFDGSVHREDINIGMHIGAMWKEVTANNGSFYNCNAFKHKYHLCGIGKVSYNDEDIWDRYDPVAAYLTKVDYHLKFRLPRGNRCFQASFVRLAPQKRGRPRSSETATVLAM